MTWSVLDMRQVCAIDTRFKRQTKETYIWKTETFRRREGRTVKNVRAREGCPIYPQWVHVREAQFQEDQSANLAVTQPSLVRATIANGYDVASV